MVNQRGINNKREKVCKFQKIFGISLIILGVIGIIASQNLFNSISLPAFSESENLTEIQKLTVDLTVVEVAFAKINYSIGLISLSFVIILIGILFYTEGRKG